MTKNFSNRKRTKSSTKLYKKSKRKRQKVLQCAVNFSFIKAAKKKKTTGFAGWLILNSLSWSSNWKLYRTNSIYSQNQILNLIKFTNFNWPSANTKVENQMRLQQYDHSCRHFKWRLKLVIIFIHASVDTITTLSTRDYQLGGKFYCSSIYKRKKNRF